MCVSAFDEGVLCMALHLAAQALGRNLFCFEIRFRVLFFYDADDYSVLFLSRKFVEIKLCDAVVQRENRNNFPC